MGSSDTFAQRMRDRREAKARAAHIERGGVDAAWQSSYRLTYQQFGPPACEGIDASGDYSMQWAARDGAIALTVNFGAIHSYMKRQTPQSAVQALVACWQDYITAPRTKVVFVLFCPEAQYDRFADLEDWATAEDLAPLRVIRIPTVTDADKVLLYIRSEGPTDWFGRTLDNAERRPGVVLEIT